MTPRYSGVPARIPNPRGPWGGKGSTDPVSPFAPSPRGYFCSGSLPEGPGQS